LAVNGTFQKNKKCTPEFLTFRRWFNSTLPKTWGMNPFFLGCCHCADIIVFASKVFSYSGCKMHQPPLKMHFAYCFGTWGLEHRREILRGGGCEPAHQPAAPGAEARLRQHLGAWQWPWSVRCSSLAFRARGLLSMALRWNAGGASILVLAPALIPASHRLQYALVSQLPFAVKRMRAESDYSTIGTRPGPSHFLQQPLAQDGRALDFFCFSAAWALNLQLSSVEIAQQCRLLFAAMEKKNTCTLQATPSPPGPPQSSSQVHWEERGKRNFY